MSDNLRVEQRYNLDDGYGDSGFVFCTPIRKLFDWQANPVSERSSVLRQYDAASYLYQQVRQLDNTLELLLQSPSIQSILRRCPEVENVDFRFGLKEEGAPIAHYCEGEITLFEKWNSAANYACQPDTVAHEIRHVVHDSEGVLVAASLPVWDHIALRRAYEADARVFEMTVAMELDYVTNDRTAIRSLMKHSDYKDVMVEFLCLCRTDPNALWDGRAQAMAYRMYFDPDFKNTFHYYDKQSVADADERVFSFDSHYGSCSRDLMDIMPSLFSMPYFDCEKDELVERPYYDGLKEDVTKQFLLAHLSESIVQKAARVDHAAMYL